MTIRTWGTSYFLNWPNLGCGAEGCPAKHSATIDANTKNAPRMKEKTMPREEKRPWQPDTWARWCETNSNSYHDCCSHIIQLTQLDPIPRHFEPIRSENCFAVPPKQIVNHDYNYWILLTFPMSIHFLIYIFLQCRLLRKLIHGKAKIRKASHSRIPSAPSANICLRVFANAMPSAKLKGDEVQKAAQMRQSSGSLLHDSSLGDGCSYRDFGGGFGDFHEIFVDVWRFW